MHGAISCVRLSFPRLAARAPFPAAANTVQRRRAMASSSGEATTSEHRFGPIKIPPTQVFVESPLSVGLVNLKPVVPGHVLILSRRVAARFADLTAEETADIWHLAKRVGPFLVG